MSYTRNYHFSKIEESKNDITKHFLFMLGKIIQKGEVLPSDVETINRVLTEWVRLNTMLSQSPNYNETKEETDVRFNNNTITY